VVRTTNNVGRYWTMVLSFIDFIVFIRVLIIKSMNIILPHKIMDIFSIISSMFSKKKKHCFLKIVLVLKNYTSMSFCPRSSISSVKWTRRVSRFLPVYNFWRTERKNSTGHWLGYNWHVCQGFIIVATSWKNWTFVRKTKCNYVTT